MFSRRGPARAVGLVPRRPQQPPPLLPLLRGAGVVERGADRRADRLRRARSAARATARCSSSPSSRGRRWSARGCSSWCSCRRRSSWRAGCARRCRWRWSRCGRAAQLRARGGQPRRRAAERLHRPAAGELPRPGVGRGDGLRADALPAAGVAVRHGGLGRRAARDVERASAASREVAARCADACRRARGASRSSSCRRWSRSSRSATSWSRRCFRPAGSARTTPCSCG